MNVRRLRLGLETLLGRPRGFFIPHRHAGEIAGRQPAYDALETRFAAARGAFEQTLALIEAHADALETIGNDAPPAPRWRQDWFPRADGAAAYALARHYRPRRIVEVGSGHSTRFLARAIADGGFACALTAIDPAPRAAIEALPLTLVREPVQRAGLARFRALEAGDMLIVDSSHVLMPGSDVDVLFNRVLPALPAGVFVHVHDVLLPDDYPEAWRWRGYNEQLAVAALLQGGGYAALWSSHYATSRMADAVRRSVLARLPLPDGAFETSLWLKKL